LADRVTRVKDDAGPAETDLTASPPSGLGVPARFGVEAKRQPEPARESGILAA